MTNSYPLRSPSRRHAKTTAFIRRRPVTPEYLDLDCSSKFQKNVRFWFALLWKLPKCLTKKCVNFGRCYGNQGWTEAVEIQSFVWKLVHLNYQKVSSPYLKAFLRFMRECTWGGGGGSTIPPGLEKVAQCPPPLVGLGLKKYQFSKRSSHMGTRPCAHTVNLKGKYTRKWKFHHWLVFPHNEVCKKPDDDPPFLLAVTAPDVAADLQLRNDLWRC